MDGFSTGAAWADFDGDGRIDLFVARYVHVDLNHCPHSTLRAQLIPRRSFKPPTSLKVKLMCCSIIAATAPLKTYQ